jgi:hypothetical protein
MESKKKQAVTKWFEAWCEELEMGYLRDRAYFFARGIEEK